MKRIETRVRGGDDLNRGDTGGAVRALQKQLRDANLYQGKITGTFDGRTEKAVAALQKARRLEPTGIVDAGSLEAVRGLDLFVRPKFGTTARVGQRGADVRAVESKLKALGLAPGR
ncbi:MAG: peptidoglycan-binding domain-containing protein, partial [Myxococcales bacterium]